MIDSKLFGLITLPRLIGSNSCFSKIIADVFHPWNSVSTHLNAPDEQTAKTFAFIEVLALVDDQLTKSI